MDLHFIMICNILLSLIILKLKEFQNLRFVQKKPFHATSRILWSTPIHFKNTS